MDSSYVEDALTDAQHAFEQEPTHKESGLDVDDDALLQLRKACRLLDAARFLRTQNGYYTVVIETSFIAIERSIHFYLLHATGMDSTEFVSHADVYQRGADANLYSQSLGDQFLQLWRRTARKPTTDRPSVGRHRPTPCSSSRPPFTSTFSTISRSITSVSAPESR